MKNLLIIFFSLFHFFNAPAQQTDDFTTKLSIAAIQLTYDRVVYDPAYFSIPYPNGDVPKDRGVCTDVVIRAYRKLGIDLQKEVHEDMKKNFPIYPKKWGLKKPDTNIGHGQEIEDCLFSWEITGHYSYPH